ncbi:MAG: phosphorylase [Mycoplasmatota bacterium]
MTYEELLESHLQYGTTKEDILKGKNFDKIREDVVIAPWWGIEMFDILKAEVNQINSVLYDIKTKDQAFSFICLKNVGAAGIIDKVLTLGVSKCKRLLFIGSAGSFDDEINIGDIVIPEYSVVGDGTCRYLNKDLQDDFLTKQYPDASLTNDLIKIVESYKNIKHHIVPNYSIDTIFAQFAHVDFVKNLGCKSIEMETAVVFKAAKICNIKTTALFIVSDNTVINKSLYSGRTEDEEEYRHKVRFESVPNIILELFK